MFTWPDSTLINRVIPKKKITEHANVSPRLRGLLTRQVQEIRWLAKLSPETIGIPATPQVAEIAIFQILLKESSIHPDLLDLLDKTIAPPILFIIRTPGGLECRSAAHKRPSASDAGQWVTARRHTTHFQTPASSPLPLPTAIDMDRLYAGLLAHIFPLARRASESTGEWAARCDRYQAVAAQERLLASRVHKERQFNRKVELNQEWNRLKLELEQLSES